MWMPIESAPRDGTAILACGAYTDTNSLGRPTRLHPMTVCFVVYHPNAPGKGAWRDHNGHKQEFLTHWMPIPKPPTQEKKP